MARPLLLGVFYSEFDNIAGPKILFQSPEGLLPPEKFDGISDYMITGKQLCGKIITVSAYGLKIMGYPLSIAHEKVSCLTYSMVSAVLKSPHWLSGILNRTQHIQSARKLTCN